MMNTEAKVVVFGPGSRFLDSPITETYKGWRKHGDGGGGRFDAGAKKLIYTADICTNTILIVFAM